MSVTGAVFLLTKGETRWYVLGRNVASKVPYALAFGKNKYKLVNYMKRELGFREVLK